MYSLDELFRGSTHKASVFTPEAVKWLEEAVFMKPSRNGEVPYVKCIIRKKDIRLTPEEAVRQLYVYDLLHREGYPAERIRLEHSIQFGRDDTRRADIVIFDKERPDSAYIIVEVKKLRAKDGQEQLISYCNASGAEIAVWTNGDDIDYYQRVDPNIFERIRRIPKAAETLDDVLNEAYTIDDLTKDNILRDGKESLKALIQKIEDKVLAHAGVDAFDEIFKLIYTKLYDETESGADPARPLEFRKYGKDGEESHKNLKARIQALFDLAQGKWKDVFTPNSKIVLTPSHLAVCIGALQQVKLLNSNLDVVDDAFEYLMSKARKGEKGQFFTPRYVIEMCVRMLNPKKHESMIDTAAGSCGFPVHTIFHVWEQIRQERGDPPVDMFTAKPKHHVYGEYVRDKVFAIDFDEKAVQVARTLNLLAGDGKTNVLQLNTLDYGIWEDMMKPIAWQKKFNRGWLRFIDFCETEGSYKNFMFDIVMANPPFAGDIQQKEVLYHYELAKDKKGKYVSKIGRDILFIERNLQFLKPGGRMAIILPQGRFNNSSDKYIRDFIAERCRVLAVIGLHENVFKPHTGTKTSVLLVQKWDEELCPRVEDYPVFFATMRKPGKDNSGEKVYVKNPDGSVKVDGHNHPIVEHDLYNHEGLTEDGIAEAFREFAVREGLSFFGGARFDEARYESLRSGLEITEVMLSELENNATLGAEYYGGKYRDNSRVLQSCGRIESLSSISQQITDGDHGATEYLDEGVTYLLGECIKQGVIDTSKARYISQAKHAILSKSALKAGDVLVVKTGDVGKSAVVPDYLAGANISVHIGKIRLKAGYNPYFVSAFLNCRYGYDQLMRRSLKTTRPEIKLVEFQDILIPKLSDEFDSLIEEITRKAITMRSESTALYTQAQNLLSSRIGQVPHDSSNITIRSFSEVFGTGRLDAEYFMPKYDGLFALLDTLNTKPLGEIVSITKSIEPGSNYYGTEGVPFIRVSDITTMGITPPAIHVPHDIVPNIEALYPKKDTVLFSKDGSVGIAYKVEEDIQAVTSGALLHLRIKRDDVLPDYLALVLNSEVVQLQAERDTNGAVIQHWRLEDIAKVIVPILDADSQHAIAQNIQHSFSLRRESEALISSAVHAVELAIESGEPSAMDYLNSKL